MFGWEFPPMVSGGLGIACHGIVQSLLNQNVDIVLALPFAGKKLSKKNNLQYVKTLDHSHAIKKIQIELINTLLQPYITNEDYINKRKGHSHAIYGADLWLEVKRYTYQAEKIAAMHSYDVIHAHEWLTVLAGIEAKKKSNKPLIFHVHALESDRNAHHPNPEIQAIEKIGLESADLVIAVSLYTKNRIIQDYHIPAKKIIVIHNGHSEKKSRCKIPSLSANQRFVVLFLGRMTEQKGPHYFIEAARKILSIRQDIEFVMAGEGDQLAYAIETCARIGISSHVHFTGFLDRDEVKKFYESSHVYVMPSVSEPFGIVCLEAIAYGVPVVISKQSGVSEVLTHSLKTDYWDINQLAENIMALLDYPAIRKEMLPHAKRELSTLTWDAAAAKIKSCYQGLLI